MLLRNYVISCHKDKALNESSPFSEYDCQIQAGAALTDKRICPLNDLDGFPESISDRNARYCELTAMFYISKHIESDYVEISHYRRRLDISDESFRDLASQGVDIITSEAHSFTLPLSDLYRKLHYSADWDLFMDILRQHDSEDFNYDLNVFSRTTFHGANLHIFKADLYRQFSEWAFPILDIYYKNSPPKADTYQNRDVGFIAERLSHLFVSKSIRDGLNVVEVPILEISSSSPRHTFDNTSDVLAECNELYSNGTITLCGDIIKEALKNRMIDNNILDAGEIFSFANREMNFGQTRSLHDYLPKELRSDLNTLLKTYRGLKRITGICVGTPSSETFNLLQQYLDVTGFSKIVVDGLISAKNSDILNLTEYKTIHFTDYSYDQSRSLKL